ncbi:MAG: hypothetical protein WCQ32_02725 [bacterium]
MEQNKITTWWKKSLLITSIYTTWWVIFYGIPVFYFNNSINNLSDTISNSAPVYFFGIIPVLSFLIPYKISKITKIEIKLLYFTHFLYLICSLWLFYVLVGLSSFKIV